MVLPNNYLVQLHPNGAKIAIRTVDVKAVAVLKVSKQMARLQTLVNHVHSAWWSTANTALTYVN